MSSARSVLQPRAGRLSSSARRRSRSLRDLHARLRLRLLDLRARARFARFFLRALGDASARRARSSTALGARRRATRSSVRPSSSSLAQLLARARSRRADSRSASASASCDLALGALPATLELALLLGGAPRVDLLRPRARADASVHAPLRLLRPPRAARRPPPWPPVARGSVAVELRAQREELGATAQRARAAVAAREPDRAARVDERRAVVHARARGRAARAPRPAPGPRRRRDATSASRHRSPPSSLAQRVERQQEQRTGVRRRVPRAHRLGDVAIAHEHRVHRGAEETLDEQRRRLVGADEVGERAEHRAVAELLALAQQPRRGGRESDALALERLERVAPCPAATCAPRRRGTARRARSPRARASRDRRRAPSSSASLPRRCSAARLVDARPPRSPARDRRARARRRAARARLPSCSMRCASFVELARARARDRSRRGAARSCSSRRCALGVLERVARFGARAGASRPPRAGAARALSAPRAAASSSCARSRRGLLALGRRPARRTPLPRVASSSARWRRAERVALPLFGDGHLAADAAAPARAARTRGASSSVRCASAAARAPCAASRACSASQRPLLPRRGSCSRSSRDARLEALRAPRATLPSRARRARARP